MNPKYKRLIILILILSILGLATKLVLMALNENIIYFYTPNELKKKYGNVKNIDNKIRIGGLVLEDSVIIDKNTSIFEITDKKDVIKVFFKGQLPDLFREGQGIVAEGILKDNKLIASQVLAKHDENYMPPEVADALIKNGVWKGEEKK
ncbi:MAG: cytochrome c maturation protein CcmE [Candidatus Puniceispirillales bacterium]|jgi:cytochrome c-type biogenesis protein CcmE|tara:strand:- start:464 stop:910 length:447 start_codon:yes stop_codon:yes gene_type:complete